MMPERHRLRGLQMGEAGHHRAGVGERLGRQRALQADDLRVKRVKRVANPQFEVERDLIVARARGMQAPRDRADEVGEALLDIHMNVLERA